VFMDDDHVIYMNKNKEINKEINTWWAIDN
jgi:hypothetical protein